MTLRRELKAHHLFALSFGTIVGTGWITGVGIWLGLAGSLGSILGFALAGFVMVLIALCYAQLAVRYPRAGGEITYAYHMWGLDTAFVTGWFMVLIYVTSISFQAVVLGWMLDVLAPQELRGPRLYTVLGEPVYLMPTLAGIALGVAIAWINYRGVRGVAQFQSWLTFGKIAVSLVFFACTLAVGRLEYLEPAWGPREGELATAGMWAVFATTPFFLAGFDVVPLAMGESAVSTSRRTVHIAIVGSLVAAVVYYALVILSASVALPRAELLAADLPAIAAFERAFGSALLAKLALVAGLMGVFTCWNASVFAASRVLYTLGESRLVPAALAHLHPRFATPGRAAIFASVVGLLCLPLGKGAILPIINASACCLALVSVVVCLGLLRLHARPGKTSATVPAIPGGIMTLVAATLGAAFTAYIAFREAWRYSTAAIPVEWVIFGVWSALGFVFWILTRRARHAISETERRKRLLGEE